MKAKEEREKVTSEKDKTITYLMSPLAPSAMESTLVPSIRIYAKDPSNPAPKLC